MREWFRRTSSATKPAPSFSSMSRRRRHSGRIGVAHVVGGRRLSSRCRQVQRSANMNQRRRVSRGRAEEGISASSPHVYARTPVNKRRASPCRAALPVFWHVRCAHVCYRLALAEAGMNARSAYPPSHRVKECRAANRVEVRGYIARYVAAR